MKLHIIIIIMVLTPLYVCGMELGHQTRDDNLSVDDQKLLVRLKECDGSELFSFFQQPEIQNLNIDRALRLKETLLNDQEISNNGHRRSVPLGFFLGFLLSMGVATTAYNLGSHSISCLGCDTIQMFLLVPGALSFLVSFIPQKDYSKQLNMLNDLVKSEE